MSSVVQGAHLPSSDDAAEWVVVSGRNSDAVGAATVKERLADAIRRPVTERRSVDYDSQAIGKPDDLARDIARAVADFWA